MINFKCNSKTEVYSARQLNQMLGLLVEGEVYASFVYTNENSAIELRTGNGAENLINTNFLALSSEFLSLKREQALPQDNLGRVLFSEEQAKEISCPLLDEEVNKIRTHIEIFLDNNEYIYKKLSLLEGPSVCLSHDVDSLKSNSILKFLYRSLKLIISFDFIDFKTFIKKTSTFSNTHGDIKRFIEIEENYNFKSSYFFLSLPFFLGREGRRYSVNSDKVKKILELLRKKKFELGLHMSRKGYTNIALGKREIKRLKKASKYNHIKGVRNHYLKGNFPHIWNLYEGIFDYDSSLGSSEYLLYRAGTSNPFKPFDYNSERELEIIEVPLIVMDGALSGNSEKIFSTVKRHIDIAFRNNSLITILWHTDRILPDDFTEHAKAYEKILDYLYELQFNSLTIEEVAEKYKIHQNKMDSNLNLVL